MKSINALLNHKFFDKHALAYWNELFNRNVNSKYVVLDNFFQFDVASDLYHNFPISMESETLRINIFEEHEIYKKIGYLMFSTLFTKKLSRITNERFLKSIIYSEHFGFFKGLRDLKEWINTEEVCFLPKTNKLLIIVFLDQNFNAHQVLKINEQVTIKPTFNRAVFVATDQICEITLGSQDDCEITNIVACFCYNFYERT